MEGTADSVIHLLLETQLGPFENGGGHEGMSAELGIEPNADPFNDAQSLVLDP